MTIINGHQIALEDFDIGLHALPQGYFDQLLAGFEEQFKSAFPSGWPEFYAKYSSGELDPGNVEYEEWAFVCEHFLREHTRTCEPPGMGINSREEPESNSGSSFGGKQFCLILSHTSRSLRKVLQLGPNAGRR